MSLNGVDFPELPPHKRLRTFQYYLAEKYGVQIGADGLSAHVDLHKQLASDLDYNYTQGFFTITDDGQLISKDDAAVLAQLKMDAANMHKGMKQTAAALTLPLQCTNPQAPADTSQVSLNEFDDHLASVTKYLEPTLTAFNQLIKQPRFEFTIAGRKVWTLLSLCCGGDLSNITDMHALSGCNGPCPCYLCEVRKEDCCSTDAAVLGAATRRTLSRIRLMSHTVLGQCPGCNMEIVARVEVPTRQMTLAIKDAKAPTKAKWPTAVKALNQTWPQMHKGVVFGASPPIDLEPWDWILCVLHLNLRIVGAMFTHLVVADIGKSGKADDQKAALMDLFQRVGIYMKERKLDRKNDLGASWQGKFSFAGADAEKIMRCYPEMSDIVYPPEERSRKSDVFARHADAIDAWTQWELVWKLLNTDLKPGDRAATAAELQFNATKFVQRFVKVHQKTQGLYLHMLAAHIGEMYLKWGDLRPFQAQGLEHCHSKRKRAGVRLTNRKKGQRNSQHMDYIIGSDYVKKEFRHTIDQQEHERNRKAKMVRALRRINKTRAHYTSMTTASHNTLVTG